MKAMPMLLLALCSCSAPRAQDQCPAFTDVAPAAIPSDYLADLSQRLAGPDRANTVVAAVADMHRRAPTLTPDEMTDILIAADCPNASAKPDHDIAADRARIAAFRAQVTTLMRNQQTR